MANDKPGLLQEIASRQFEEKAYEAVAEELAAGVQREGLWLKAVADGEGDGARTKALYVRYRVQSMLDEAYLDATGQEESRAATPDVTARYNAGESEAEALRRDGVVLCLSCSANNATDLGRPSPLCGRCGSPLC